LLVQSAWAAETVKIGILWPLTGNAAAAGQASKAAAEVAADIVNNKHPGLGNLPLAAGEGLPHLGGAKLELTFVDHQGNPSLAQQLATRLITQDKVHALMGAYQSSCTFTATPVAERHGIPFMVGESSALNITGRGLKWVFRTTPISRDFGETYMRFFADMKKQGKSIGSIALVNENTDYGTSVAEAIEAAAKTNSIPVAIRIPYSAGTTDVSAQVLQLKQKQPDVVIFISYTSDSILYMKTMKNLDYLPPMPSSSDAKVLACSLADETSSEPASAAPLAALPACETAVWLRLRTVLPLRCRPGMQGARDCPSSLRHRREAC
jgi:branched-chain amino acid transport system substrate-binding protein